MVSHNTFINSGIEMHGSNFQDTQAIFEAPFSAQISDNAFVGGRSALDLDIFTNITVFNNRISGYSQESR